MGSMRRPKAQNLISGCEESRRVARDAGVNACGGVQCARMRRFLENSPFEIDLAH